MEIKQWDLKTFKICFEDLKTSKTQVNIFLVHGYPRKGYIIEIREDCLCLERKKGSETIDYIIPFQAISSVDIKNEN